MKGIKAKTLVLPAKTDLYFREFFLFFFLFLAPLVWESVEKSCARMPGGRGERTFDWSVILTRTIATAPEDSEIEVENMRPGVGEMRVFPSIWGHWAGGKSCNLPLVK
jgi:hypothetical protein